MSEIYEELTNLEIERDAANKRIAELEAENERLLVLATKWCPKNHHDWAEILTLTEKIDTLKLR